MAHHGTHYQFFLLFGPMYDLINRYGLFGREEKVRRGFYSVPGCRDKVSKSEEVRKLANGSPVYTDFQSPVELSLMGMEANPPRSA